MLFLTLCNSLYFYYIKSNILFRENHEILVWINQPKQVGSILSFCFYLENNQNDQLYGFKFEGRYNEYQFKPKYGILKPRSLIIKIYT